MLTVEEITNTQSLRSLSEEWSTLWDRCPAATPFQSPEWLVPWWEHFGGAGLWTLALREHGRLAGLAPMFIYTAGTPEVRQVTFLGNGISDYLDVLIEPAVRGEGMERMFDHLAARRSSWDVCDFQDLREGSPLLEARVPAGIWSRTMPGEVCPFIELPETLDAFIAGLPPNLRRNLRRYRKRLAECGPLEFEIAAAGAIPEYLDAFFRLHRARWEEFKGTPGVLAAPEVERFHRAAAPVLASRGLLRLHGMRFHGALTGVLYLLAARKRAYAYLSGFDPALAGFTPGTLLVGYAIEAAIRAGAREFDFLRGPEPHKYAWGAKDRRNSRWIAWHSQEFAR